MAGKISGGAPTTVATGSYGPSGADNAAMAAAKAKAEEEQKAKAQAEAEAKAQAEEEAAAKLESENQAIADSLDTQKVWEQAGKTTANAAVGTAGKTALNSSSSMMRSGLSKSQAANLGEATLANNTVESYTDNVQNNADALFKSNLQKAIATLNARQATDSAEYLQEAADSLDTANLWSSLANGTSTATQGLSDILKIFNIGQ